VLFALLCGALSYDAVPYTTSLSSITSTAQGFSSLALGASGKILNAKQYSLVWNTTLLVVEPTATATYTQNWVLVASSVPGTFNIKYASNNQCINWLTTPPVGSTDGYAFTLGSCPGLLWFYSTAKTTYATYSSNIALAAPTGSYAPGGIKAGIIQNWTDPSIYCDTSLLVGPCVSWTCTNPSDPTTTVCVQIGDGYYQAECTDGSGTCIFQCPVGPFTGCSTNVIACADPTHLGCSPACDVGYGGTNGSTPCSPCTGTQFSDGGGPCQNCRAPCPSGYWQYSACTATVDRICLRCTTCGTGYHVVTACTATSNAVCGINSPTYGVPPGSPPSSDS